MPKGKRNPLVECPICKEYFRPSRLSQKVCSVACSNLYKATLTYPCICNSCGKSYMGKSPASNWCNQCRISICVTCGKEFIKSKRDIKHCSRQCVSQNKERNSKAGKSSSKTKQRKINEGTFVVATRVEKEVSCVICGSVFQSSATRAKYCDSCKTRTCIICGSEFIVDMPSSNTSTCSIECRGKHHSSKFDKTSICSKCGKSFNYHNKRDVLCDRCKEDRLQLHEVKCELCGKVEQVPNWQFKEYVTCSKDCANKLKSIRQTKEPVDVTCVICGKVVSVHPAYLANEKKTCSDVCLAKFRSEMNKGENNPLFGIGHSLETKRNLSIQASIRHANGLYNFAKGEYISKISLKTEKYDSSWELERFKQLDKEGIHWTKKHGIRIGYWWENTSHYYVPDILIYTEPRRIEEIKPKHLANNDDKTKIKIQAGRRWSNRNGYDFVVVTENELFSKEK